MIQDSIKTIIRYGILQEKESLRKKLVALFQEGNDDAN
jgi:hypothetical protein